MSAHNRLPRLIRPRVEIQPDLFLGPGKYDLLLAIAEHGSISAAARALGMGYRRAWTLLNELQAAFDEPVVETAAGGTGGGGAQLTAFGRAVVDCYRDIQQACEAAAAAPVTRLGSMMKRGR